VKGYVRSPSFVCGPICFGGRLVMLRDKGMLGFAALNTHLLAFKHNFSNGRPLSGIH